MSRIPVAVLIVFSLWLTNANGRDLCTTPMGYEGFISGVMENAKINSVIGHLNISGNDSEIDLGQIEHSLFLFDPTSRNVLLLSSLDTDVGAPPILDLVIVCKQLWNPSLQEIKIKIHVLVEDYNDNTPEFLKEHYNTSIREDAPVGTVVYNNTVATDRDKPFNANSRVFYRLVPTELSIYFRIDTSTNPVITLAQQLDYENITKMVIFIEASDSPMSSKYGPQLSSTATLTVNIIDADDLNPEFTSKTYRGVIREDAEPGTFVDVTPAIVARDPDSMNVSVVYRLLDPYELFAINATTALVQNIKPLYVDVPTITVVVLASQIDNARREWFTLLTISITEANINAPRFSRLVYEVTKTELEPVGSTLVVTTATDIDFGTVIQYSLIDAGPGFSIDNRGSIILEQPLDFEIEQQKTLLVTASDGSHTATATVRIYVLDVNDNNPLILEPATPSAQVRVNRIRQEVVTRIIATDHDVGSSLSFTLGSFEELFSINRQGWITITAESAQLTRDSYSLLVYVTDDGVPPRQSTVLIEVIFPPTGATFPPRTTPTLPVAEAVVAQTDDNMVTIILGAVAGVLLVVIVILVVYIIWRNKRTKEELDRARAPKGYAAKGLTYRQAESPDDIPNIYGAEPDDPDGFSQFDGNTSVQNNPLQNSEVNDGYLQSSGSEIDRDLGEIEVATAVVPYDDDDDFNFPPSRPKYQNSPMRTFQGDDTTSSGSSDRQSDSTGGSRHALVKDREVTSGGNKMTSWDSDDKIHPQGSQKLLDQVTSPAPARLKKDRPEITVYF